MKHTRAWAALALAAALSAVGLASAQAVDASAASPVAPQGSVSLAGGARAVGDAHFVGDGPVGGGGPVVEDGPVGGGGPARPMLTAPVSPLSAFRLFEPPPEPWNAGHRGIDLLSLPGAEVRSPGAGTVAFVGTVVNRGVLSIDLDVGLRASFEPVSSALSRGTRVAQGEVVGAVEASAAASHCEPRYCLHWGLRRGDEYLDPLDWLAGFGPIRLLRLRVQ